MKVSIIGGGGLVGSSAGFALQCGGDGSAKAGVLFAIAAMPDIQIPVHYIGVGESIDDLRDFEADVFVDALLKPEDD